MRHLLLACLSAGAALAAGIALVSAFGSGGPQSVTRPCQPSLAQQQAELAHLNAGAESFQSQRDVSCSSDPTQLVSHGPYRIVPQGYAGPLDHEIIGEPPAASVPSNNLDEVHAGPMYREPSYLPVGFAEASADTYDGTLNTAARVIYSAGSRVVEVIRVVRSERPRDVYVADPASPSTALELQLTEVDGCPAVVFGPKVGALKYVSYRSVSFICGNIETSVRSPSETLADLMAIAKSIQRER